MSETIEFTQLIADARVRGEDLTLAEDLRTRYIESDPNDVATTDHGSEGQLTITSGGEPMTVSQVQSELQVLISGE